MILDPDDHPQRYTDPSEAFADAARRLRDDVLQNPEITHVYVMVGAPGSGKSKWARAFYMKRPHPIGIVDGCHAKADKRRALAKRISDAGKVPIAVYMATDLHECLLRNNERDSPKRVPPQVIERQTVALHIRPPRMVEGWAEVIEVNADTRIHVERVLDPEHLRRFDAHGRLKTP